MSADVAPITLIEQLMSHPFPSTSDVHVVPYNALYRHTSIHVHVVHVCV